MIHYSGGHHFNHILKGMDVEIKKRDIGFTWISTKRCGCYEHLIGAKPTALANQLKHTQ